MRRWGGTAVEADAPRRGGAKNMGAAVARTEDGGVETQSSMVCPPLHSMCSLFFLWTLSWLGFEVSMSREEEQVVLLLVECTYWWSAPPRLLVLLLSCSCSPCPARPITARQFV